LRHEPGDHFFLQAGAYDGDTQDSPSGDPAANASGTHFRLSPNQGMFGIAELGWKSDADKNKARYPGIYRLGAWVYTADAPDNFTDAGGNPWIVSGNQAVMHDENFGAYLAVEQMIYREQSEEPQGISLFLRMGGSPPDRSLVEFVANPGLGWRGMIPGREADVFGAGCSWAKISREVRRREQADHDLNGANYPAFSDSETAFEMFYQLNASRDLCIQPDFQWILRPGGSAALPDAFLAGVRVTLLF
jgi:porin